MKKILIILISLIFLYLISLPMRAYLFNKSAEQYAVSTLNEIATPWNSDQIIKRASPFFIQNKKDKTPRLVQLYQSYFGGLVKQSSVHCNLGEYYYGYNRDKKMIADCKIEAEFEKRKASIILILYFDGNFIFPQPTSWSLDGFKLPKPTLE